MVERVRVTYRFRRFEQDHQAEFGTLRAAAQRALLDTDMQEAIPLEISRNGKRLFGNPAQNLYCGKELRAFARKHRIDLDKYPKSQHTIRAEAQDIAANTRLESERADIVNTTDMSGPTTCNAGGAFTITSPAETTGTRQLDSYTCPRCRGAGQKTIIRWGIAWDRIPCTLCDGSGSVFGLLYDVLDYTAIADSQIHKELVAGGVR